METYYRGRSRVIAIIDIIWSSVGLGSTILTFFGLAVLSQAERGSFKKVHYELPDDDSYPGRGEPLDPYEPTKPNRMHNLTNVNVMLGVVMLSIAINTIQLVAAIRLLKACDLQTDSLKALKCCRFWCGVTIFFVVLLGLNLFSPARISLPGQIFSMAQIMFRALGLYYVSEFIKEVSNPVLPVCDVFAPRIQPQRTYYPKPPPPPPYPQDESGPPPPYHVSEAPPPYEDAAIPIPKP